MDIVVLRGGLVCDYALRACTAMAAAYGGFLRTPQNPVARTCFLSYAVRHIPGWRIARAWRTTHDLGAADNPRS
jgi:hypothetical protein